MVVAAWDVGSNVRFPSGVRRIRRAVGSALHVRPPPLRRCRGVG